MRKSFCGLSHLCPQFARESRTASPNPTEP